MNHVSQVSKGKKEGRNTSISTQVPVIKDRPGPVPVYDSCSWGCTTRAISSTRDWLNTIPAPKASTQPYFPASGPAGGGKSYEKPIALGASGNEGRPDNNGSAEEGGACGRADSGMRVSVARVTPIGGWSPLRQL